MPSKSKGKFTGKSTARRRGDSHLSCSRKRRVIKDRLRELEIRVTILAAHLSTTESFLTDVREEE